MIIMYTPGSAAVVNGVGVDIAHVDEENVEAMIMAGWGTEPPQNEDNVEAG